MHNLDFVILNFNTMPSSIAQALKELAEDKGLSYEVVLQTVESALAAAYRKDFGEKNQNVHMTFDPETGGMEAYDIKTVVEDVSPEELEALMKPVDELRTGTAKKIAEPMPAVATHTASSSGSPPPGEAEKKKFNPRTEIMLTEAQKLKADAQIGDVVKTKLEIPAAFGRMAAQTAKQVIMQKIREAEREALYTEWKAHEHAVITGMIGRREQYAILVDLGKVIAYFPTHEQLPNETYRNGQRYKFYIVSVNLTSRGPEIILSRSHPDFLRHIFTSEIPEVASQAVVIKDIAREAGWRAKVAVVATKDNVDPIGSCIGQRGTRIQTVIAEVGGEKIDLIEWSKDPAEYVAHALSPAKVMDVLLNEEERVAVANVMPDQFSLAIGRGGQNVRLAAKLTGWKITVKEEGGEARSIGSEEAPTGEAPSADVPAAIPATEAGETSADSSNPQ